MMGSSWGKIKASLGLSWVVEIMLSSQEAAGAIIAFLASNLVAWVRDPELVSRNRSKLVFLLRT